MAFDVLIIDDEIDICMLLSDILTDEGYTVRFASDASSGIRMILEKLPNVVIMDVFFENNSSEGILALKKIKENYNSIPVVMISGHGTIETAVKAIKHGAYDFIEKPFTTNRLLSIISKAIESSLIKKEVEHFKSKQPLCLALVGRNSDIELTKKNLKNVGPSNVRILIEAPDGANRESIARYVFELPDQTANHFRYVNLSNLSEEEMEIFFFGLEQKEENSIGIFDEINEGMLMIDEIEKLDRSLQKKFTHYIQNNKFQRLGSKEGISFNTKMIFGTSLDMNELVKAGGFDNNLFSRICTLHVKIPKLLDRLNDFELILEQVILFISKLRNIKKKSLSNEAVGFLKAFDWAGDIQQLLIVLDLTLMNNKDNNNSTIEISDIPFEFLKNVGFVQSLSEKTTEIFHKSIKEARDEFEVSFINFHLKRFNGSISQTAKTIGMERSALYRKMISLRMIKSFLERNNMN